MTCAGFSLLIKLQASAEPRGRGGGGGRRGAHQPPTQPHFLVQIFFPRKIGKHKIFTSEEHVRLWLIN